MKIRIPITPARVEIEDGYEVDYSSRDIIPIRFSHALAAVIVIPLAGFTLFALARPVFEALGF